MKIETMRRIDYYIGIPLCFFLSVMDKALSLFFRPRDIEIRRTLFIELSEMGSAILVDPAMRFLKEKTSSQLFFVIFKKNKPSLELLKTIPEENIFTISEESVLTFALDTLKFLWWTRAKKIDTLVDLELFSRFTALLAALSGATRRVGFHRFHQEGLYRGSFLTHRVSYNPHQHMAKNFLALVSALLTSEHDVPFTKTRITDEEIRLRLVSYSDEEKTAIQGVVKNYYPSYRPDLHRIVLVNPNASEMLIQRRWPLLNYSSLIIRMLKKDEKLLVLITGDARERAEAEEIRRKVNDERCVNFAGAVKLQELPVLYSISKFMVTNDSGPAHFASITSMPTYVFFGPETPILYRSLGETTPIYAGLACSPCVSAYNHRKTPCRDNKCLKSISPEDVFEIIRPALEDLHG